MTDKTIRRGATMTGKQDTLKAADLPKLDPAFEAALLQVREAILKEPRRLNMEWLATPMDELPEDDRPPCGNTCCIGGWLIKFAHPDAKPASIGILRHALLDKEGNKLPLKKYGPEYGRLFYVDFWPTGLQKAYKAASNTQERAAAAVAAIDDFVASGGWQNEPNKQKGKIS